MEILSSKNPLRKLYDIMNAMREMSEFAGWLEQQNQRRQMTASALIHDSPVFLSWLTDIARRFYRGGRLLTFGNGCSHADAQHIAVEFVHPVIVGKRALPLLFLSNTPDQQTDIDNLYARQIHLLGRSLDYGHWYLS